MASFGEELKRERELRDISLKEISEATKISVRFLEALEQDRFEVLPGGIFNRGFIRAYARFIGIDGEAMVNAYLQQVAQQQERHKPAAAGGAARSGSLFRPTTPPPRSTPPRKPSRGSEGPQGPSAMAQIQALLRGRAAWLLWGLAFVAFLIGAIVIALSLVRGNGEASPASQVARPAIPAEPAADTDPVTEDPGAAPDSLSPEAPRMGSAPPARPPRTAGRSPEVRDAGSPRSATPAGSEAVPSSPSRGRGAEPEPEPRPADPPAGDGAETPAVPPTAAAAAGGDASPTAPASHALRLQASEITRVRVECNGRVALFQELWPGQEISLRCDAPVLLSADNGGAVTWGLDGRETRALGEPGERVEARAVAPRSDGN